MLHGNFFNPFLKNDALFTTGCLHFPAHVPLQRSVQVLPNPRPAPFNPPACYETVVFEPAGDHGIFLPPGTGFLLIRFTAFLIQVCSNIASVVNPREFGGRLSKVSVNVLELGLAGWNVPVCDRSWSECFLERCLGFFPSPDKICLVFSNYGYVVGMIQSVKLVRWTVRKIRCFWCLKGLGFFSSAFLICLLCM